MTSTKHRAGQRPRADKMHDIERKHFGRCIDQVWGDGRRALIELMEWPRKKGDDTILSTVVLIKRFEKSVPKNGGNWPDLEACYVYVPIQDDNTWEGLDNHLSYLRTFEPAHATVK